MNILVVGSGGREHAICQSFARDKRAIRLFCASGNAGVAGVAECVPIRPDDIAALATFAVDNKIDLTFVGGETPLALGIVDEFESRGLRIIGPPRAAAQLEASKSFAKDFMARYGVPTAKFVSAHSPFFAILELESVKFGDASTPVVVKADGLAAGKGVVIAANRGEAVTAINEMANLVGTAAADKIVIEECLVGKEISLLMFASGEDFALMPPTRDHKRISEGNTGPNTGGMGAVTDSSLLSPNELQLIVDTIVRPTLRGCVREGFPFRGILFLGLMMIEGDNPGDRLPMLLEYNVRFGDPETQAILIRLETDLVDICEAMLGVRIGSLSGSHEKIENHQSDSNLSSSAASFNLNNLEIKWRTGSSVCIVLASKGYPSNPEVGDVISGVAEASKVAGVEIFHAGTARSALPPGAPLTGHPPLVTSGGRVLGVTATGGDLDAALGKAYEAVGKLNFDGMQYRRDIGRNV